MNEFNIEDFIRLETEVWWALADGDADADADLLSTDFLGVYPSGFADRADHSSQLHDGPTIAQFELSEARLLPVTDSAVILAYRAAFRRPSSSETDAAEAMYVSSLWCERDGRWVNVFSQDTPAAPHPA